MGGPPPPWSLTANTGCAASANPLAINTASKHLVFIFFTPEDCFLVFKFEYRRESGHNNIILKTALIPNKKP
jgi:hypothetical protein